jgi:hypothetical protein
MQLQPLDHSVSMQSKTDLVTKEDYYKDSGCISFSSLKVFSRCETLYRDLFVDKTYEEPDHDYFTYGKLVDALVSEPEGFIEENFVRVERKVKPEDALKYENEIKGLEAEISEKTAQMNEKVESKKGEIQTKIDNLLDLNKDKELSPATTKKIDKLKEDLLKVEPDKTLAKGIEGRRNQITELQKNLDYIKQLADKIQVTNSIWVNAEATALAIQSHPAFSNIVFNDYTSQQIFVSNKDGIPRKGKLDHLKLSPALTRFYAIYAAEQMTIEELQERIRTEVHPQDLWAIITDVKTCKDIASLEPYNMHYRGQLGFYQDLVSDTLLIPVENIRCRILAADKLSNDFKKCELFEYTQDALNELKGDVEAWVKIWWQRQQEKRYVSAKEKDGWHQKCFTCSECRFCPFSTKPGEPVMVAGPRFGAYGQPAPLVESINTADAVLDY